MAYNTIKIKKYLDIVGEKVANAAITPGMLIELMSTDKVRAHASAEGNVFPMFALEDELQGNGIDDAYAADDQVQYWIPQRGEEVYAIIADGQAIAIADLLVSNGDGYLREYSAEIQSDVEPSLQIVAQAIEAVDTSDSSGGESSGALGYAKRIKIRIV
jgi:hypothetical protein